MRIVVLVKQVPSTDKVKMDEKTGTMVRSAMEAVRIKEKIEGTEITVVSMGPPSATYAIREAIAMGCNKGVLLSDSAFAGADTWATACTLSSGVKKLGEFGGDIFEILPVLIERLRERKTVNGKGGS